MALQHVRHHMERHHTGIMSEPRQITRNTNNQESEVPKGKSGGAGCYRGLRTVALSLPTRRHLQDKSYQCPDCDYSSRFKGNLEKHYLRHTGEKPYKCRVCDYAAIQSSALYAHMKNVHPGTKPFKCNVCDEIFDNLRKLKRHRKTAHGKTATFVPSLQPSGKSDDAEALKSKALQETTGKVNRRPHNCNTGNGLQNEYGGDADISDHHTDHHNATSDTSVQTCHSVQSNITKTMRPVNSTETRSAQRDKHLWKADMATTTGIDRNAGKPGDMLVSRTHKRGLLLHHSNRQMVNNFKCTVCSYSCKTRQNLEKHLRRHAGEKPFKCRVCGYAAAASSDVYSHTRKKHPSVKPFMCTVCDKTFITAKRLRHHSRLHHGKHRQPLIQVKATATHSIEKDAQDHRRNITRNIGNYSGHGELSTADAGSHSATPAGDQPEWQCDVCRKTFDTEMMLSQHLRQVHIKTGLTKNTSNVLAKRRKMTRKKKNQEKGTPNGNCRVSGSYRAGHTEAASRPTRRHLQDKSYQCPVCDYASRFKGNLKRHYRRHTGEKPFKCRVCDYAVIESTALYAHMKKAHPGTKPFKCNACGEILGSMTELKRHWKRAHGENAASMPSLQPNTHIDEAERLKSTDLQATTDTADRGAHNFNKGNGLQNEYGGEAASSDHHRVDHDATADTSLQTNQSVQSNATEGACQSVNTADTHSGHQDQHFCKADMARSTETDRITGKQGEMLGYRTRQRRVLLHHSNRQVVHNFKCTICSYSCKTRLNLEKHIRRHTGEKPFACRVCGFAAADSSHIYSHMRKKHPSVRPFNCSVCDKAFGTAKRLRHHSRLHRGATPGKMTSSTTPKLKMKDRNMRSNTHQQPLTQLEATVTHNIEKDPRDQRSHHTRHRRKASGNRYRHLSAKPYKCPVCTYSCSTRSILAVHVRIHTGEKPYKCTLCDYETGYNSSFYIHMRKQHPGANLLKCMVCGAGFITPRKLMMHLKVHMVKGTDTVATPLGRRRNQDLRKRGDSTRGDSRDHMHVNIADSRRTASKPYDSAECHENDAALPGDDDVHSLTLSDADVKYQCDVCKKRFGAEAILFIHLQQVHIGTVPSEETGQFP